MKISILTILTLTILFTNISTIETFIYEKSTCMKLNVSDVFSPTLFAFHCDQVREKVNLVIYDESNRVLNESGSGIAYNSYVQVMFPKAGTYKFCFEKERLQTVEVSLDIVEAIDDIDFAGKEDINKVARRISGFLIDIRKTGFELKQVLSTHLKIKQNLKSYSWGLFWWSMIKIAIMGSIVAMQVYVVKKIYE